MSRIGKKPIPLPSTVKYKMQGNTVLVEGPKGKLTAMVPTGITLETKDGNLFAVREKEEARRPARFDPRPGLERGLKA